MARFESEEKAKEYIDKLEQTLKSYDDEIFNINSSINESKNNIKSIELLQDKQRQINHEKWLELPMLESRIDDPEPKETTIDSILGDIL